MERAKRISKILGDYLNCPCRALTEIAHKR